MKVKTSKRAIALPLVLGIIIVLGLVGAFLSNFLRNEMSKAANLAEEMGAAYLAESALNHGIFLLNNYVNDVDNKTKLGLNKLFGKKDDFEVELPLNDPGVTDSLDVGEYLSALAGKNNGKIDYLRLKFKTVEKPSKDMKIGKLTLEAKATFGKAYRIAKQSFLVVAYHALPIQWDKAMYIANPAVFQGYKKKSDGSIVPLNTAIYGNIYARSLEVQLNSGSSPFSDLASVFKDPNAKEWGVESEILSEIGELKSRLLLNEVYEVDEDPDNPTSFGKRGMTDLTGYFVKWANTSFWKKLNPFSTVWSKSQDAKKLEGNITRVYKRKVWEMSGWKPVKKIYTVKEPFTSWVDKSVQYPENKVDGVLNPELYKRLATKQPKANKKVTWTANHWLGHSKIKVTYNNVAYFYGWGDWRNVPRFGTFWRTIKSLFKAPTRADDSLLHPDDPKKVIQLNGIYYVDGDVAIEGYYRGSGVIVAAGDIYITGELKKHPVDKNWLDPLNNNMLQLVALGTKPGSKGKVIIKPHPDTNWTNWGVFNTITGKYMLPDRKLDIEAYIYAKNGLGVDKFNKWWFGTLVKDDKAYSVTIKGNLVCKNANRQDWPANVTIVEDSQAIAYSKKLKKEGSMLVDFNSNSTISWHLTK